MPVLCLASGALAEEVADTAAETTVTDPQAALYYPTGIEPPTLLEAVLPTAVIVKFALLLALAVAVFYVANWAFMDTRFVNTSRGVWGAVVLAGGVAGLASATLVPIFYLGLPLGLVLFAGASVAYAQHRNSLVTAPLRVLTKAHLVRLRSRLSGHKPFKEELGPVTGVGRDIIFIGYDDLPKRLSAETDEQRRGNREVERVLYDAVVRRASAVGLTARPQKGDLRFRIDGQMVSGGDVEPSVAEHFTQAVKRLANLDPNETRKPQEGRLRAVVAGQTFDLRVQTAGNVRGEQVAIRITDVAASRRRLEDLGLSDDQLTALAAALGKRPGLVLLSSPRDSGLTTTIHACLRHFDRYVNNVMVFEGNVEVEIENVQHIAINQEDGPVAAAEVRSRVRMEPDVVAIDALYQAEVAQVVAAAANEHTVVVGIRAADASQALARVGALFGSRETLAERLQIIVNQRLVRLLCPECKEAYRPNPEFLRKANLGSRRVDILYRPPSRTGPEDGKAAVCPRCGNSRYVARAGLFELMPIDDEARAMIARGAALADLRTYARKLGMRNLQEEGLRLVIEGRTCIEEVLRAIKQES
ncbi:MAG TPA: ATPase, T2SS/T4P/T4SS family [Phycisphaerae bacterium]|nr:ATPase, T2SS/T4P/T4SS family [Phycisphaerae bacterium]